MNIMFLTETRRSAGILCLLAIAVFSFSCATVDTEVAHEKASAYYKIGVSYLNEGKAQQAFVEFQRAYELNPADKEVLYAIGMIYLLNFDDIPKSIEFFQKAVKTDPNYSDAYNNLGYAHAQLGRYEEAISFYKKALSNLVYLTPEQAYTNMGQAYYRLGKFNEAAASYRDALKRSPNFDRAFMGLALCYNATGKYGDASAALTHAISLSPLFKGDRAKASETFTRWKIASSGPEQKDYADYLEILKY